MIVKCGVDLVRSNRLSQQSAAIRARFIERVFTEIEQAQAQGNEETLSGIFAAKEAASKALGTGIGKVAWREIEVIHAPTGEPGIVLHGFAAEVAAAKGLRHWAVSISHDGGFAIANVVAVGEGTPS